MQTGLERSRPLRPGLSSAAVRLVPADTFGLAALAELFNEAYSDYVVPLRLDPAALEFTLAVTDVDLAASRIALDDGEPAAFAFLARRGDEAWIGGMGTVPTRRRRGLGEAALAAVINEARDRGAAAVRLEVIEENSAARRLYEKLGFEPMRDVVVWRLEGSSPQPTGAIPMSEVEARAWIAANRPSPEPWQRADETLERWRARGLELEGLAVVRAGGTAGALVYRHPSEPAGLPSVLQIAAQDEEAAMELLAAVSSRDNGFRFLNAPAGEPASRACERLGARSEIRQCEMRRPL